MIYTSKEIARIVEGEHYGSETTKIRHLAIDSRSPLSESLAAATMFCALGGANDGHRYIAQMFACGVRTFLVKHLPAEPGKATYIVIDDVEAAITRLARHYRESLVDTTFIGITGSVGKTSIKELLYETLLQQTTVARSPRSWNSRIGVPLSVCGVDNKDKVAIIEAGIDRPGTMGTLESIVKPQIGILTPITNEHDAGFESRRQKIAEKLKLFKDSSVILYPDGNPELADMLHLEYSDRKLVAVGGDFNRAVVAEIMYLLGFGKFEIPDHEFFSNRIDVHEGVNDCVMLFDEFTADAGSLCHALDFMSRRSTSTRTSTIILSDLLHTPDADLDALYNDVAQSLADAGVSRVIAIGSEIATRAASFAPMKFESVASVDDFLRDYDINDFSSETIMIFGRPKDDMTRIKSMLESPRHDTTLEINLDSVVHNFNYYRSLLKPTTKLVAMVKASAYGTGAVEISKTLQSQGAGYLAVAVVDEGVELRRGGITMPIMVLNPITGNYKALFDYNLEPSIFSMRELDTLSRAASRAGVECFRAHIKLDTGMHRVGFTEPELDALIEKLHTTENLEVASIFSHLATADCLDKDEYTAYQLDNYRRMSQRIVDVLPYKVLRHVLNTAGIMRFADHQYDMVRLGIGLYGVSPLPGETDLRPVATLRSTIISIHRWKAGTCIGYGCRGVLNRDSVIATVAIGYADGLDRHLSRGNASFVVKGVGCKTVGNICMDQCMIDVTDVPDAAPGDLVEIFGEHMPLERIAATLDTIPYEVISTVAPRVKRIYYRD